MPYPLRHSGFHSHGGVMALRLPFEIVALIISFLNGPKSVLLPLARVCRHWTGPAHACIYRKIVISRTEQWAWLVWSMHVNPSLRGFVRILKVTTHIPYDQRRIGREITANLFPYLQEAVYFWSAIDFSFLYTLMIWAPTTLRCLYVGIDSIGVLRFVCEFLRHHQDRHWDELTFDIRPTFPMTNCQDPHLGHVHVNRLNFLENIGDHACPSQPPVSLNLLGHSCLETLSSVAIHFFPTRMQSPKFDGGAEVPAHPLAKHDGRYITLQQLHLGFHNFKEISFIEQFRLFWIENLFKSHQFTLETGQANLVAWNQ